MWIHRVALISVLSPQPDISLLCETKDVVLAFAVLIARNDSQGGLIWVAGYTPR